LFNVLSAIATAVWTIVKTEHIYTVSIKNINCASVQKGHAR